MAEAGLLGRFYIGGVWQGPVGSAATAVVNPATEQPIAETALGTEEDADRAIAAARQAFDGWSRTSPVARAALLDRVHRLVLERREVFAQALTREMGAAIGYARGAQVPFTAVLGFHR